MVQEGHPVAYESRKLNDRDKEVLGTREGDCCYSALLTGGCKVFFLE